MTIIEFHKKWSLYLTTGYYGLEIDNAKIIDYLDTIFEELTKIPGFEFHQIKLKFNQARFYTNLYELGYKQLSRTIENSIEIKINELLNKEI